jgi:hypothetical protein
MPQAAAQRGDGEPEAEGEVVQPEGRFDTFRAASCDGAITG